jgi:hypothetical protein
MHRASNQDFAKPVDIPMPLSATEGRSRLEAAFQARFAEIVARKQAKRERLGQGNGLQRWWGRNAVNSGPGPLDSDWWYPRWTQEHHLLWRDDSLLVGERLYPDAILRQRKKTIGQWWLARVRVRDGVTEIGLVKWLVGDDGKIKSREQYIAFVSWVEEVMNPGGVEQEAEEAPKGDLELAQGDGPE